MLKIHFIFILIFLLLEKLLNELEQEKVKKRNRN